MPGSCKLPYLPDIYLITPRQFLLHAAEGPIRHGRWWRNDSLAAPSTLALRTSSWLLQRGASSFVPQPGVRRLGSVGINVAEAAPENSSGSECRDHSGPNEDYRCNGSAVVPIPQRAATVFCQQPFCSRRVRATHICALSCENNCIRQRRTQSERACQHGTDAPGELYSCGLASLGPEEVEEEGRSKDSGDVNADEDVVRGDANIVVVVDPGGR